MDLPDDVIRHIAATFPEAERDWALGRLRAAVIHTGEPASGQLLRCAAVAARGRRAELEDLVSLLKVDWRDVIMAGEYGRVDGSLRRLRDLTGPIDP